MKSHLTIHQNVGHNKKQIRCSDFRIYKMCKAFTCPPSLSLWACIWRVWWDIIKDPDWASRTLAQQGRRPCGASRPCAIPWLLSKLAELKCKKILGSGWERLFLWIVFQTWIDSQHWKSGRLVDSQQQLKSAPSTLESTTLNPQSWEEIMSTTRLKSQIICLVPQNVQTKQKPPAKGLPCERIF